MIPARAPIFLIALLCLAACAPEPNQSAALPADHYFEFELGPTTFYAQLALNDNERSRGLMFREALDEDHGMLFVFPEPARRSFYMRNTPLPLDIGYFDDTGRLLEIHSMFPHDETPVPSRSPQIQFALEMNRGWFQERGVQPGARLSLESLAEAIEDRAIPPARYNLP